MGTFVNKFLQNYITNHQQLLQQDHNGNVLGNGPMDWITNAAIFAGSDALLNKVDDENHEKNNHLWRNAGLAGALALGYQYYKNHHNNPNNQQQQMMILDPEQQQQQGGVYYPPQEQQQYIPATANQPYYPMMTNNAFPALTYLPQQQLIYPLPPLPYQQQPMIFPLAYLLMQQQQQQQQQQMQQQQQLHLYRMLMMQQQQQQQNMMMMRHNGRPMMNNNAYQYYSQQQQPFIYPQQQQMLNYYGLF